ncbi:hypothetical protein BDZ45DRAFT_746009 [Acephala macrosclerotiorum]|nr:hypothetical protein BDZ45DRAFT_746009 [Acephala macrosclerotiorum]
MKTEDVTRRDEIRASIVPLNNVVGGGRDEMRYEHTMVHEKVKGIWNIGSTIWAHIQALRHRVMVRLHLVDEGLESVHICTGLHCCMEERKMVLNNTRLRIHLYSFVIYPPIEIEEMVQRLHHVDFLLSTTQGPHHIQSPVVQAFTLDQRGIAGSS